MCSDVYWLQSIINKRPNLKLQIEGKRFKGLIDTGADVTIIRGLLRTLRTSLYNSMYTFSRNTKLLSQTITILMM